MSTFVDSAGTLAIEIAEISPEWSDILRFFPDLIREKYQWGAPTSAVGLSFYPFFNHNYIS
jgi:hypothetical protein